LIGGSYTAPEVFAPGRYSLPADVFSFAVLAWDLFRYPLASPHHTA